MPVKLSELKAGDILVADGAFTCLKEGERCEVKQDSEGLYVECAEGKHSLNGQLGDDRDTVIGFERAAEVA